MPGLEELAKSNVQKVKGKFNKNVVQLVTISTCIWCKRMKNMLNENEIEYEYTDIDLLPILEKNSLKRFLLNYTDRLAFPMAFVNGKYYGTGDADGLLRRLKEDGN
ncbi:MAG: glutaredoxin [Candidatus Lokiarchaeota archaeon]|nr:glutaredoxin [Candidatus Lokiarchaeota archaeon]